MGIVNKIFQRFKKPKVKIGKYELFLNTQNPHEKKYFESIITEDYIIAEFILKNNFRVLDLGANIGYTALVYLKFGAKSVICFEPVPELANRIRKLMVPEIELRELAVGNEIGIAEIFLSTSHNQGHSLNKMWPTKFAGVFKNSKKLEISVTTLNDAFPNEVFDFIKIDVEGNESETILGGNLFFERNRDAIVQIEIYDWQFEKTHQLLSQYFKKTYVPIIEKESIIDIVLINTLSDITKHNFKGAPNYLYSNKELLL